MRLASLTTKEKIMVSKIFYRFIEISEFLGEGGVIAVVLFAMFAFIGIYFVV